VTTRDGWAPAVRGAGATAPDEAVAAAGADLWTRWGEPHRHYHTRDHLTAVLSIVDANVAHAAAPDLVRLAAWFHDAVYDPQAADNESTSAALAAGVLDGLGVPFDPVDEVRRLVLLTAGHDVRPGDSNGELLCDADLAVLAGSPSDYDQYAEAVRREYSFVPDQLFRAGRATVLRGLLDLPTLYRVPGLARRWEEPARANLRRELAKLTSP
jgi:predicted metal-dependent HD superfamily phosphohydrolase